AFHLVNSRNAHVVAREILTAFDSASRRTGLLGRDGIEAHAALILAPCNAVHTCFMRFRIDVAFVDKAGVVLSIKRNLVPWRIAARLNAHAVIEMAAGALEAPLITVGDRLTLESR